MKKKRVIALMLAICMVAALLPITAGAVATTHTTTISIGTNYYVCNGVQMFTGAPFKTDGSGVWATADAAGKAIAAPYVTVSADSVTFMTGRQNIVLKNGAGVVISTDLQTGAVSQIAGQIVFSAGGNATNTLVPMQLLQTAVSGRSGVMYVTMPSATMYTYTYTTYDDANVPGIDSGAGYELRPDGNYNVNNATGIAWVAQQVAAGNNFLGKYIFVAKDINLNTQIFDNVQGKYVPYTHSPIGTDMLPFRGTFDGGNFKIINLKSSGTGDTSRALFGCVADTGTVRNVKLSADMTGANNIAGIVAQNYGLIDKCSVEGTVSGTSNVAGVAARNNGIVSGCSSSAAIKTSSSASGGIVGENFGTVRGCSNSGTLTAATFVGGIVGRNENTVSSCTNNAPVSASDSYAGGIVGYNGEKADVSGCNNTGRVTARNGAGGVIGQNYGKFSGNTFGASTAEYETGDDQGTPETSQNVIENTQFGISVIAVTPGRASLRVSDISKINIKSDVIKRMMTSESFISAYNLNIMYNGNYFNIEAPRGYIFSKNSGAASVTFQVDAADGEEIVIAHYINQGPSVGGGWLGSKYFTTISPNSNRWQETLNPYAELQAGKVVVMESRTRTGSMTKYDRVELQLEKASRNKVTARANSAGIFLLASADMFGAAWTNASEWALPELTEAQSLGMIPNVLSGADMTINISRAQFAAVIMRLYENMTGKKTELPSGFLNPFADTSDLDVQKAFSLGFVAGTSLTLYSPDGTLTREQASSMLARVIKKTMYPAWTQATDANYPLSIKNPNSFSDDASINSWAKEAVYYLAQENLIVGNNNKFMPQASMTCQEALSISVRTNKAK